MRGRLSRRALLAAAVGAVPLVAPGRAATSLVPPRELYAAALALVRRNVRGGAGEPRFRHPFLDAAFSRNLYLWDSCFMAAYAKYPQDELPIEQSLDHFYELQEADGHICREYTDQGVAFWPKEHPVSVNPPLLAFAELELQSVRANPARLRRVYPSLRAHYRYLVATYLMPDGLYFSDAFGSGMDNIARCPRGWQDDGHGIVLVSRFPEVHRYEGLSPCWNRQGRSVDLSAQMALCA